MSYPYGGGYPGQQPGYPPQQGGYPPQPGYPTANPAMPMPDPSYGGGQPGYGAAPGIGFQGMPFMPDPGQPSPYAPFPYAAQEGGPPNVAMPAGPGATQPTYGAPMPGYPPQGGAYPPQGGAYPPQGGAYPPQGGAYPPAGGAYPPAGGAYPPAGGAYPPAGGAYPPAGGAYPPAGAGYPGAAPAAPYGQPAGQPGYQQPPAGYGQPPAHQAQAPAAHGGYGSGGGYGTGGHAAPPTAQMASMSLGKKKVSGTVRPTPGYNPQGDAEILRKAMKGIGTDEKAIIDVLAHRTNAERVQVRDMFKTMYGKDLLKELKSELSGRFEDVCLAMLLPPNEYDARELHKATEGIGTKESVLVEIMCSRSNAQIKDINDTYKRLFRKKLEEDLMSDTSGHFRRLMVSLCMGNRQENQPVDVARAKADAQALYQAGEAKLGTDESRFNSILAVQSFEQLAVVFDEYHKISKHSIEQAIKSEMSGDLADGMLAIVKCAINRPAYFAEQLYKSMKGAGTYDTQLIRVVVTRCEVDMVQIKQEFSRQYGKSLESFIKDDCSGDYKRMLVAIVS